MTSELHHPNEGVDRWRRRSEAVLKFRGNLIDIAISLNGREPLVERQPIAHIRNVLLGNERRDVQLNFRLDFHPPLPDEVAGALARVPMGTAAKLAVGTKEPPPLRAIQDVEMPYWCWTGNGGDGNVRRAVTAFCGSVQSRRNLATDSSDPSTWLERLRSANPDLEFVGDPLMVDWSRDEWARGCYSAFDNPATDVIPVLSQPVGRLFFAGEHTTDESGTMEGALVSGRHAAEQVAERLA